LYIFLHFSKEESPKVISRTLRIGTITSFPAENKQENT